MSRGRRASCTSSGRRRTRERSRSIGGSCAPRSTAHDGVEVDTQGDAFFVAFPTAPGALAAAAELTEALAGGPISVRVGVHTGTPFVAEEGYVGVDVHRAARIAAAGHGAQVLVSASTATLVDGYRAPRPRASTASRISRRPERVFQLGSERVSAAEDALPDEPARAGDTVSRPGAGAGRGRRAPRADAAADAHRPGRRRQDAARAAGGGRRRGRVPAGRLVGAARRGRRPRVRPRRGEPGARSAGRARRGDRRPAAAAPPGQLRARDRRGARALRAARRLPEPRPARDESRAAPDRG